MLKLEIDLSAMSVADVLAAVQSSRRFPYQDISWHTSEVELETQAVIVSVHIEHGEVALTIMVCVGGTWERKVGIFDPTTQILTPHVTTPSDCPPSPPCHDGSRPDPGSSPPCSRRGGVH